MDGENTFRNSDATPRASSAAVGGERPERMPAIDRLRGLVIVLMVLDHVRNYFTAQHFDPTDLAQTTPGLFLTRWVTHLCAPCFVFLAGMSARLAGRTLSRAQLQRFLVTRGLWLIALEFTLIQLVASFNLEYSTGITLQIIWVLGASMCTLAALVALPVWSIAAFGVLVIAGHDALTELTPESLGAWAPLWSVLHVRGPVPFGFVLFPLVPWVGVMAVGYAFGELYRQEQSPAANNVGFRRVCMHAEPALGSVLLPFTPWIGVMAASHTFSHAYRDETRSAEPPAQTWSVKRGVTVEVGLLICAAFFALRLLNGYGDPQPWSEQRDGLFTLFSFLNTSKYPASLAFVLMTMGPVLLLLAAFGRQAGVGSRVLQTFGRVPLFAYVVHLALAHLLAGLVALGQGYGTTVLRQIFLFYPSDWGFGLGGVFAAWTAVVALLYPLCRWFAELKRRRTEGWLAYL